MKRLILIFFTVLVMATASAQYRGGAELGFNILNANVELGGPIDTKSAMGIRLGYVGEASLSDKLFFRFGIIVNQRGFKFADERWGLNALDFPLNLGLNVPLDGDKKFFIDAGLNLEYYWHAFTRVDGEVVELAIGSGPEDIKPFGTGFNVGTGIELNPRTKLRVNYYKGFTNLVRTPGDEWKNSVIGFSLDYFF